MLYKHTAFGEGRGEANVIKLSIKMPKASHVYSKIKTAKIYDPDGVEQQQQTAISL